MRALSVSAAMAKRPWAKPGGEPRESAKRASLMSAMPAQAASTTQASTHQPSVSREPHQHHRFEEGETQ